MTNLKETNNLNNIKLQLFASEGVEDTNKDTQDTTATDDAQSTDAKTYTEAELQKLIQSEADKRVTGALSKKEKEYQDKLLAEQNKANMTVEELQIEKQRELDEREAYIKTLELETTKLNYFKTKNYDVALMDFVSGSDESEIQANSDSLIAIIDKVVEKQIGEKLKEKSYSSPLNATTSNSLTKDDFMKLGYTERVKLSTENPKLYKELSK